MTALELLNELKDKEINIRVENDKIKLSKLSGEIDSILIEEIKTHKKDIIAYLSDRKSAISISDLKSNEIKEHYPLSPAQKRLYYLQQVDSSSSTYNMPAHFHLYGFINIEEIKACFQVLINRHEILRTSINVVNGEPVQKIHEHATMDFGYEESTFEGVVDKIYSFTKAFDLEKVPLIRAKLLKISKEHHILLTDMHHIVVDEESIRKVLGELFSLFHKKELPLQVLQYKDYVEWISNPVFQDKLKHELDYWKSEFEDEIPEIDLPIDKPRPDVMTFDGSTYELLLQKPEFIKLNEIANYEKVSMFVVTLCINYIFLNKICNQDDIVIGTPVFSYPDLQFFDVVGMFVNTLPIRHKLNTNQTFLEFVAEVNNKVNQALDNRNCQIEDIVASVLKSRKSNRNPLFDFMFKYDYLESAPLKKNEPKPENIIIIKPFRTKDNKYELTTTKLDLMLTFIPYQDDEMGMGFAYNKDLFNRESILRFGEYLKSIVKQVTIDPNIRISDIGLLHKHEKPVSEEKELSSEATDYDKVGVLDIFEKNSQKVSIESKSGSISKTDIISSINTLSNYLINNDIKTVGVQSDYKYYNLISCLACAKTGSVYVPIDHKLPTSRIKKIVNDGNIKVILGDDIFVSKFSQVLIPCSIINADEAIKTNSPKTSSEEPQAQPILCQIYDKPFGSLSKIEVGQKNLLNTFYKVYPKIDCTSDYVLSYSDLNRDTFIYESLFPLLTDKKLVLKDENEIRDVNHLNGLISEYKFSHLIFNTELLYFFIEQSNFFDTIDKVKQIVIVGSPLKTHAIKKLKGNYMGELLYILSHPETSFATTIKKIQTEEYNNVGNLVDSLSGSILSGENQPLPELVYGKLLIKGGCLNRKVELSQSENSNENTPYEVNKFLLEPEARYLLNGEIQIKEKVMDDLSINGYQVSVQKLEDEFKSLLNADHVVVLPFRSSMQESKVVAFVVSKNSISTLKIRKILRDSLPEGFIPSKIVQESIAPILENGKLNRSKIERSLSVQNQTKIVPMDDPTIATLAGIWKEMLKIEKVAVDDNFFDIGGHSLLLVQVSSKIKEEIGIAPEFSDYFNQTFGQFATNVKERLELLD